MGHALPFHRGRTKGLEDMSGDMGMGMGWGAAGASAIFYDE